MAWRLSSWAYSDSWRCSSFSPCERRCCSRPAQACSSGSAPARHPACKAGTGPTNCSGLTGGTWCAVDFCGASRFLRSYCSTVLKKRGGKVDRYWSLNRTSASAGTCGRPDQWPSSRECSSTSGTSCRWWRCLGLACGCAPSGPAASSATPGCPLSGLCATKMMS